MNKHLKGKSVIITGAGLGGLSAAISLATDGAQVTVLEKNDKAGGKLNLLIKEGFSFDLGPSILTYPQIFRKLFDRAGKNMEDYVQFDEVFPHWRNFFEDGFVMDLTPDLRAMEEELKKLPGNESEGFFKFLEYSRNLTKLTEEGYFEKGLDTFGQLVGFYGPHRSLFGFDVFRSMDQSVRRFIKNEKLVHIMNYFIKYVGSSPYDSPALLNLLPYVQFGYGLWYVRGGMYRLAEALQKLLVDLGGKIYFHKEVVEITKEGDKVTGVRIKSGEVMKADIVVSNMEVIPAYQKLLKEETSFLVRLAKYEPSCSGLVLHLGVNKIYPQLAHHNFFYSADSEKHFQSVFHKNELSQDPTIYLVAPCKTDPSLALKDCEIIKILPHIPHIHDDRPLGPEDYLKLRERVLIKLERMGLRDLRKNTIVEDMWTPVDIRNKYYSNKGSIYGVVSNRFKNFGFKIPQRSEKYKNLYFVGGSVNPGGGMPMVTLSGQLVRDKIIEDFERGKFN